MSYIKAHNFWKKILSELVAAPGIFSGDGQDELRTLEQNERFAVWLLIIVVLAAIAGSILSKIF